jgi:predicted glycogen debranching enzyme
MADLRRVVRDVSPLPQAAREWLVANGLGGYASATINGMITRSYHGFLIAAQPSPLGRMVVFNDLDVDIERADGSVMNLRESGRFLDFTLNMGLPSWRYEMDGAVIEKSIVVPWHQNIVHCTFRSLGDGRRVCLRLRPLINFRPLEAPVSNALSPDYTLTVRGNRYEVSARPNLPMLRLAIESSEHSTFTADGGSCRERFYDIEAQRGYDSRGWLWSPGYFAGEIRRDCPLTLIAATAAWHTVLALSPEDALTFECERRRRLVATATPTGQSGFGAELVLAADTFVISPVGRIANGAAAHAEGHEGRTVIAGYHWFTDWGRDTMISLEGLTLATGRAIEAQRILRSFAHCVRDGLIPNLFPERQHQGLYHTADATLWFFHALHRYVEHCQDKATLTLLLPILKDIVRHHLKGTRFGIKVDPHDGLLVQGAEGYALTWMDAKVGDWVVTPRRGKAVEINALWYNALCLLADWLRKAQDADADDLAVQADKARDSFNRRFCRDGGHLYDVVDGEDGNDPAFRPNQIFAIALDHPVLEQRYWEAVVNAVRAKLVTPVGLRSLAPGEPGYKPHYLGDLHARDAAYHQGTVWAWLIGPFIDAWLKVYPDDRAAARHFVDRFEPHLAEAGIGFISEIFDAEPPFTPRGCIAQAWSVAEVLRCLMSVPRASVIIRVRCVSVGAETISSSGSSSGYE